ITVGSCDLAVREAVLLLSQDGVEASYLRVRGFPFPAQVRQFIDDHEVCFVVEQNRDAQLKALIQVETGAPSEKLRSVLVYGGLPLSAREVVAGIKRQLEV
ncbi:MAG: 2-oxoacid:acceptor oxidoreductase subunit alpha, partial [Candidatus Dormibacteria bacterium]